MSNEENQDISLDEAISGITDLIDDNLTTPVRDEDLPDVKPEPTVEKEEVKAEEESDEDYLADVDTDEEDDGDTPEETAETEEAESDDEDANKVLFKDGDEEVTKSAYEELKKGNLRQADYTKKTQELAEQRKAFDEDAKTLEYLKVQKEFQPKMFELQSLQTEIAKAEKAIHYGRDEDGTVLSPDVIRKTKDNVEDAKRKLNFETDELNKKISETPPPKLDALKEKVPELFSTDDSVRKPVLDNFAEAMRDIGYSQAEIDSAHDPRLLLLLKEVVDGRELAAKVAKAKARKSKKPSGVVSKSTRPTQGRTAKSTSKAKSEGKDYQALADSFHDGTNPDAISDMFSDFV